MAVQLPPYAEEYTLRQLRGQLCNDGPYGCRACEVQCAFGRRYLKEVDPNPRRGKPVVITQGTYPLPKTIAAQKRVYNALMDLERGLLSREEVAEKYGYSTRRQLTEAIRLHKKKALARFGGGESAG